MSLRRALSLFRGHEPFHMDIIGRKRLWFTISGLLIVASLAGLFLRGLNYSIDFEGGAVVEYVAEAPVTIREVEDLLVDRGLDDARVQIVGGNRVTIRTEELNPNRQATILEALAEQAGITTSDITLQNISPTWGSQISRKAIQSLVIFLILVSIYIAFRFEWKMAAGALVALFHDIIITTGVYALVGREVTPETVIAVLTILGYSLYDTVVIYDKIKENGENLGLVSKEGYSNVVNLSLNQVFMRSVNTSLVVLLPITTLLLFGGETLKDFAFALLVGTLIGAYSSIFVAAPFLTVMKEREPRYAQIRARIERGARPAAVRPVTTTVAGDGAVEAAERPARQVPAAVGASRTGTGQSGRASGAQRRGGGPKKKSKRRRR